MLRSLILTSVFLLAMAAGLPSAAQDSAAVLIYHRFGEPDYPATNIRLDQFDAHLEELKSGGYTMISLDGLANGLEGTTILADKTVVITIDDAFASFYTHAWPRLRDAGIPVAILFQPSLSMAAWLAL